MILVDNGDLENWMIQDKTGRLGRIPKVQMVNLCYD